MRRSFFFLAVAVGVQLAAACGGKVVVDPGAVGAGGVGTGGSSGGSSSSSVGGSGGEAQVCGGKQGAPCGPGEFCKFEPAGSCGGFDDVGTCQPRPTGCLADCPGVCGCDGVFYCNACDANAMGVDTRNGSSSQCLPDAGPPPPQPDQYAAYAVPTNLPRYVITKTEPAADRCTMIVMAGIAMGITGIQTTMGWSVERAFVTPHAADCAPGPNGIPAMTPLNELAKTTVGMGTIKQDNPQLPCWVSLDAVLAFAPGSPWVPSEEILQADNVPVQGQACDL